MITEDTEEQATLDWFQQLGYALAHGPEIAPGEPKAERTGGFTRSSLKRAYARSWMPLTPYGQNTNSY